MNRRGTRDGASPSSEETFQKAVKLFQNGRLKKAEALLGKLLKSVGDNPDILHMLALVALKTNRPDAAKSHLERAVCLAPETARLHALLGLARKQVGQVDAAEVAYRQAIALNPRMPTRTITWLFFTPTRAATKTRSSITERPPGSNPTSPMPITISAWR